MIVLEVEVGVDGFEVVVISSLGYVWFKRVCGIGCGYCERGLLEKFGY